MTPPLAFGLPTNGLEWMLVSMVVLLLFGAKRLPELAKGLGRSLQEFKRAREDFESELHRSQHEPQVSQPTDRQLHYRPATPEPAAAAGSASSALEQQVRELQQQLREMQQRQNPDLPPSAASTAPREQVVVESRPGASGPAAVPTPVVPPTHSHP